MACLYIDQLKSHFPKIEPSLLRTKPNEKWCPQVLLETLGSQTSDDYDISNEFAVRNAANNFLPKVPKIFAIGLRLDREDADNTSVSQCWKIDSMKTYLKDYFAIIRSYQNYFCTPWKSELTETTDGHTTCPFNFHEYAIIGGGPTKFEKKNSAKEQEPERVSPKGDENDSKCKEQRAKYCDLEDVARPLEPLDAENMAIDDDKIRKKRSNCTMTSRTSLLSSEKKDRECTGHTFPDSRASKSKRHVSVQTEDPGKSRHGKSMQGNEQKQTEIAAAKDVETIFAANSETFNKDSCNTDSELPMRQTGKASRRVQRSKTEEERSRRKCGGEKSSKRKTDIQLRASMNTKENIYHLSNGVKGTIKKERRRYYKKKGRDPIRNVILFDKALSQFDNSSGYAGNNVTTLYQNRDDNPGSKSVTVVRNEQYEIRRILGTKVENYADPSRSRCTNQQSSYESLYSMKSTSNHLESKKAFWEAWNYSLEDKSSELTILGNVKKRLEEDYDDYFSFKDMDLETDLFVDVIDLDSCTKVNANGNDCTTVSNPQKSKSMSTTWKHQELHQRQLRVQSFRTSLTRSTPSSMQILNTDLHRMERCSCHDSLKEQEHSTDSSIEYCTASSLSLTNVQSSSRKDSVSMLFQSCSVDTRMPLYTGNLKPCGKRHCFSKDSLLPPRDDCRDAKTSEGRYCYFEEADDDNDDNDDDDDDDDEDLSSLDEDEVFLDSRDFADRTLVDSCTVCYYRRKSAPKFAKSSKLVESLDSGILTDCSRGGRVRIVSEDRLRWTVDKNGDESRRCCANKSDLLPTYDFDTDSSYSDESLDRRVDMAVRKFTENLILSERRARSKLLRIENPSRRRHERKRRKKGRQVKNVPNNFPERSSNCVLESSPRFYDDDWLISSSSPPLYSFSESEMDHL